MTDAKMQEIINRTDANPEEDKEMTDAKMQEIVNSGLNAGKKRNDIVGDIYSAMGTDANLSRAFTLYNQLSKASGLVLDKDGKEKLLAEIVAQHTKDGSLDREAAVNAYVERGRIGKGTATSHIREYCDKNGIAFPLVQRVKRDMGAVKNAVKTWNDAGEARESIIAGLKEHFAYTDNTAADAYRSVGKELGILQPRTSENRESIAKWFKDNGAGERKDVVEGLSKAFGLTTNTAAGYYSMLLFAKTYCALD